MIAKEAAKNVGGRPSKDQIAVLAAELWDRDELKAKPGQKIVPLSKDEHAEKTATKAAELFNTNRTTSPAPAWIDRHLVVLVDLVDRSTGGRFCVRSQFRPQRAGLRPGFLWEIS